MAAIVPETAGFVRKAVIANPGLTNFPYPMAMQMQYLIYGPLKTAVERSPVESLGGRPLLIVIDGLDECQDKDEVKELIESILLVLEENPLIPLRILIASRVEQHIQSTLKVLGVGLCHLVDHCSDSDIATFLNVLFEDESRRNPVIQAYAQQHGEWPTQSDKCKLVNHVRGSCIFASAVFKFVMGPTTSSRSFEPTTPMERLPLALKINPGLDGLYMQTLARSEHLPNFLDIISAIAPL